MIAFRGPVALPSLTSLRTGDCIEYDLHLAADDELLVDTATGTVTLNGSTSRLDRASNRSVPEETFTLPPGTTNYAFRAASGTSGPRAACIVRWRSTYW
ncbi:hypothetical protein GCM10010211_28800 [Streptomyces albospinus]|uniref:Siphovirus-type tail component C-terminal domain-containing protein n=1 Tax=Streptomyces albospinus TaxID=285515 RepID=A0ABQ2V2G5_9ACTN|nr:hypothetical protein [Streptomyces albospinus]GGU62014.1 hypothetical protein GCM10010211_28800 [Streptomyces albospinus]